MKQPEKTLLLDWIEILESGIIHNDEMDKNDVAAIDALIDYLKEVVHEQS